MKWNNNLQKNKWFAYTVATCSAVALYLILTNVSIFLGWIGDLVEYLRPIILGVVFAYILNPICNFFEEKVFVKVTRARFRHLFAVASGVSIVIAVIAVLMVAFVPQLLDSAMTLISNAGVYATHMSKWLDELSGNLSESGLDVSDLAGSVNESVSTFLMNVPTQMDGVLETSYRIGLSVGNIFLGVVLAIYFLMDKKRMIRGIKRLFRAFLTTKRYRSAAVFFDKCNEILLNYIGFDILDGAIIGVVNFLFMLITGMPYALLISVIVAVTNLAPTFGPMVGGAIGAFVLVLDKPVNALIFVAFTIVLQTIDAYVIKPRVFGSSLDVPDVWILISIILGGKLFGVTGILLGIPFAAIVNYIYKTEIERRLEAQRQKQIEKEIKEEQKNADKEGEDS